MYKFQDFTNVFSKMENRYKGFWCADLGVLYTPIYNEDILSDFSIKSILYASYGIPERYFSSETIYPTDKSNLNLHLPSLDMSKVLHAEYSLIDVQLYLGVNSFVANEYVISLLADGLPVSSDILKECFKRFPKKVLLKDYVLSLNSNTNNGIILDDNSKLYGFASDIRISSKINIQLRSNIVDMLGSELYIYTV